MKLGLTLGYRGAGGGVDNLTLAREADRLGYAVCWAAEAYGYDAPTVLAWVAACTQRIDVGSAVMQIPARTPAMTAMTAATLDAMSGGRFRLGLGVSGPQVSEGWHGVRFDHPLARTREYVEIVRMALRRETVRYEGAHWTLPLPDGPGKALRLTAHPARERVPVYLAAIGPRNLELTGEIADGWLGIFFSPAHASLSLDPIRAGRARSHQAGSAQADLAGFDVVATVPVAFTEGTSAEEWETVAGPARAYTALYLGGMGSRTQNFYNSLAVRMGYEVAARQVQELYLERKHREAAAAVPADFLDATCLIGPFAGVRDGMQAFAEAGVTTLTIGVDTGPLPVRIDALRRAADALDAAGVG